MADGLGLYCTCAGALPVHMRAHSGARALAVTLAVALAVCSVFFWVGGGGVSPGVPASVRMLVCVHLAGVFGLVCVG